MHWLAGAYPGVYCNFKRHTAIITMFASSKYYILLKYVLIAYIRRFLYCKYHIYLLSVLARSSPYITRLIYIAKKILLRNFFQYQVSYVTLLLSFAYSTLPSFAASYTQPKKLFKIVSQLARFPSAIAYTRSATIPVMT